MKTNLRQARKDKGLTQQQLADRVYVTSRTIIALEKEDVPMEELFDLRENKEKEDKKYEDL